MLEKKEGMRRSHTKAHKHTTTGRYGVDPNAELTSALLNHAFDQPLPTREEDIPEKPACDHPQPPSVFQ